MKKQKNYSLVVRGHLESVSAQAERLGISTKEIAERTGFTHSNVSRMLSGKYVPRYDNFLRLVDAVGLTLSIESKHL